MKNFLVQIAHARQCGARTLRAVSRLISTPLCETQGIDTSVDTARVGACATWFRGLTIIRGIVDELSDQTAYRRFLTAHGVEHSPTAWREFQDEHWQAKSRRGRGC
jgi:hypothetical protein